MLRLKRYGLVLLLLGVWMSKCEARPRKLAAPAPTQVAAVVHLKAERPTLLYSMSTSGARGSSATVSVRVRNSSPGVAKDVFVYLTLRSGISVPIKGPKTIGSFGRAVFYSTLRMPPVLLANPEVTVSCSTCRQE